MKGICFTEPLFHATIEGRKTMTRRIMNPQPLHGVIEVYGQFFDGVAYSERQIKPRYKVGDIVYLKESYHVFDEENKLCLYRFSPKEEWLTNEEHASIVASIESLNGWKNKLFMPTWAARHFIKITAVRAERLQEISDRDCSREGIDESESNFNGIPYFYGIKINGKFNDDLRRETPREVFAALIDKINGHGTWESNPWVFVYEYEQYNKE